MYPKKLTTAKACEVAGLHRDRFNEYVAAGLYNCAPKTVPGRARLFDPDDMLTLFLFKRFIDDGYTIEKAGNIACVLGEVAKQHPEERFLSYVEDYFIGHGTAFRAQDVPAYEQWDDVLFSGTDIRKVTTFRIGKERELVAHYTAQQESIIGDPFEAE